MLDSEEFEAQNGIKRRAALCAIFYGTSSAAQYNRQHSILRHYIKQLDADVHIVKYHDIVRPMLFNVHFDNLVSLSKSTFCSHGDLLSC